MNQIQSVLVKDLKEQENIRLSQKNKKENVRINKRCQFPIVTCYHKCEGIILLARLILYLAVFKILSVSVVFFPLLPFTVCLDHNCISYGHVMVIITLRLSQ